MRRRIFSFLDWHLLCDGPLVHDEAEVAHQVGWKQDHGAIETSNVANQGHESVGSPLVDPLSVGQHDFDLGIRLVDIISS